jgi:hypothetical protein
MKYIISEIQLLSLLYNDSTQYLYEANIDPKAKLWNVIKIPTKIGINAYTATSNRYPENALGPVLNNAKTRWKKYGDLMAQKGDVGEGYLYAYLIKLINDTIKENPVAAKNARALREIIDSYFELPVIVNGDELLTKEEAERMKRELFNTDKNSFKHKGAALIGKEMGNAGRPTIIQGKKKVTGLKDILLELFYYDEIQFYDDDIIAISEYAKDEMIRGGIPQSFADELNQIFNDPQNKIDPGTGVEFDYDLVNIPSQRIKNMLKHYKNVIDQEGEPGLED